MDQFLTRCCSSFARSEDWGSPASHQSLTSSVAAVIAPRWCQFRCVHRRRQKPQYIHQRWRIDEISRIEDGSWRRIENNNDDSLSTFSTANYSWVIDGGHPWPTSLTTSVCDERRCQNDLTSVCNERRCQNDFFDVAYSHIMSFLLQLHWLTERERIDYYKLAVLVCQCLHGTGPVYLAYELSHSSDFWTVVNSVQRHSIIWLYVELDYPHMVIKRFRLLASMSRTVLLLTSILRRLLTF